MGLLSRGRPSPDAVTSGALLRELLYGDVPLSAWRSDSCDPVSARFQAADAARGRRSFDQAVSLLTALAGDPGMESRDQLQAWTALREPGLCADPDAASRVLGVVLEVPREGGTETIAGYADGSARSVDHRGAVAVLEPGAGGLHGLAVELVDAGQRLAAVAGPPMGTRPARPLRTARASMLCPGGLVVAHQEPWVLVSDPVTAPVFVAGSVLAEAMAAVA